MSKEHRNDPAQNDGNTFDVEHESIDDATQLPQKGLPPSPISRLRFLVDRTVAVGSAVVGGLLAHKTDTDAMAKLQKEIDAMSLDHARAYAFVVGNSLAQTTEVFAAWRALMTDYDTSDSRYGDTQIAIIRALTNPTVFNEIFPVEQAPADQVKRTHGRELGQVNKYESYTRLVKMFQRYGEGIKLSPDDTGLYLLAYAMVKNLPMPLLENPYTEENFKRQDAFAYLDRILFLGRVMSEPWDYEFIKFGVEAQLSNEIVGLYETYNITPVMPNLLNYLVKAANGENLR